jgi:excisionase family DNA binding protein
MSATYTATQVAERLGCSAWLVYEMVREGTCPVEPIRLGRKLVWARASVDRLLGLEREESS